MTESEFNHAKKQSFRTYSKNLFRLLRTSQKQKEKSEKKKPQEMDEIDLMTIQPLSNQTNN